MFLTLQSMDGEVGQDMNEASQTRSIVDTVVSLFSQKSKEGAVKIDRSGNQKYSASNSNNLVRGSYRDCTDSSGPNGDSPVSEMVDLSKSPYAPSFPPTKGQSIMSGTISLPESYQNKHGTSSSQSDRQEMQLLQLHCEQQQQLRVQQQRQEQQQIRLQQLRRLVELNRQSPAPNQQTGNSPQRHNREYIGGAAAAAYNALRHDYYAAKQDGQTENQKESHVRPNPAVNDTVNRMHPNNFGFPNFVRTDPREHYELLKLHRINLLEEIQETSLMLNLYEQQRLQKSKEIGCLQSLHRAGSTIEEDEKGNSKTCLKKSNEESDSMGNDSNDQENIGDCSQSQSDVDSDGEHHSDSENDEVASFAGEEDQRNARTQVMSPVFKSNDLSGKSNLQGFSSSVTKRPNDGEIDHYDDQGDRKDGDISNKPSKQPKCELFAQI